MRELKILFISRCLGVESCVFDFAFYKVDFSNLGGDVDLVNWSRKSGMGLISRSLGEK